MPPITIRCDCGEARDVAYGERWTCEKCARTWNTAQIPEQEYRDRLRVVSRYRLVLFGPLVVVAAVVIPLAVFVNERYVFLLALLAFAHTLLYLPLLRRRASRRVTSGPGWTLDPE